MKSSISPNVRLSGCLIDWLTFTLHGFSLPEVYVFLGLSGSCIWNEERKFLNGYPLQYTSHNMRISAGADDPENFGGDFTKINLFMGICVNFSGKGCRDFEEYSTLSWMDLFHKLADLPAGKRVHYTRIDFAYDDFDGILDAFEIAEDALSRNFTGPAKYAAVDYSDNQITDVKGCTVYIGSPKSDLRVRIYDKLAERIAKDESIDSFEKALAVKAELMHWVRVEIVLRDDRAAAAIDEILQNNGVGSVMCGILRHYCCFRVPSGDSNKSRWPIAPYWESLIGSVSRIVLWTSPGVDYDVIRSAGWLNRQYGQLLIALDKSGYAGGIPGLLAAAKKMYPRLNPKYQAIVDQAYAVSEAEAAKIQADFENRLASVRDQYSWLLDTGLSEAEFAEFVRSLL